jgi:hypothetical protein
MTNPFIITDMDRAWAELIAGRSVTEAKVIEIKAEYEDWVDSYEQAIEESPELYAGN